jgi:hypothetical protein
LKLEAEACKIINRLQQILAEDALEQAGISGIQPMSQVMALSVKLQSLDLVMPQVHEGPSTAWRGDVAASAT